MNGYRMPAEWEPHDAVWLAWPWDPDSFGYLNQKDRILNPQSLPNVEKKFLTMITSLQGSERVFLMARKEQTLPASIENMVTIIRVDYQDPWTRDYMPTFVKNAAGKIAAIKWQYDVYGGKWAELLKDTLVWSKVNEDMQIPTTEPGIIMEGGAIDADGKGLLVTTKQCLLKRNAGLAMKEYEKIFAEYLGITNVIWLEEGLVNDHTDGHIDDIARFVAPHTVVCGYEEDPSDANYQILKTNYDALTRSCTVVALPMPHLTYANGTKAPASYCNFYIGNTVVLVPTFRDPNDEKALEILRSCFPDRTIIGIDCVDLVYGGGTIHCVTQQQPHI